jgi:hypothetical protein
MNTRLILAIGALLLGGSPARAEVFRYKWAPGAVQHQRVSVAGASMLGPAGQLAKSQFRSVSRQLTRVRSFAGGIATLDVTETPVSGVTITAGQREEAKGKPTRSLVRLTERGRFISRQRVSGDEDTGTPLDGVDALYGLNFPARDLKPGDSRTDVVSVGKGAQQRKVTVTTRYVRKETFAGRSCAKFSTVLSMPLLNEAEQSALQGGPSPEGKLTGALITYFDPARGVEVYSSGWVAMVMKADLSSVSPEAGELATVTKINVIQQLVSPKK